MERKKLKFMEVNEEDVLDREQMRNIMAGSGCGNGGGNGLCDVYCCDNSGCCSHNVSTSHQCTSNEDCQSWARNNYTCEGSEYYIAGYC